MRPPEPPTDEEIDTAYTEEGAMTKETAQTYADLIHSSNTLLMVMHHIADRHNNIPAPVAALYTAATVGSALAFGLQLGLRIGEARCGAKQ